jgi:orotate phosphoribosyltransferase-like protein
LSTKADQLEWRRSKVIELRSRGLSYQEIAHELQVSKASITSDVQYLREQAKESIKEYASIHLVKLELLSNATTIDSALSYIRNKQQQQQGERQKGLAIDSTITTNQVF